MAEQILMIALSPTMEEGAIKSWNKKVGDSIKSGDVLCEVETDKASMDYESTMEGTLLAILKKDGETAKVGESIAILGAKGEDFSHLLAALETAVKKADSSGKDQGTVPKADSTFKETPIPPSSHGVVTEGPIKTSPLARKMATVEGLNLQEIIGTGPSGRIIKRDIEAALQQRSNQGSVIAKPSISSVVASHRVEVYSITAPLKDETVPVSKKRKIIADRLSASKFTAPHYYLKVRVWMDTLLQARTRLNEKRADRISLNAFVLKFVAEAIKRHPIINATWQDTSIVYHKSIDIGLAVAQDDGLITPVVRDCGSKGIVQIDEESKILIKKALDKKIDPVDYTNATFSISNLGSFGIEEFTAIINPPGSAILAIGETMKEPVVGEDDTISIRSVMKCTLSCDHRIIDGAIGAAFLKELKDMFEDPIRVLY